MKFTPLSNHVILEAVEETETTKSGIVIPPTVEKKRPMVGIVISVGPGKFDEDGERMPMSVKVGDKVLFKKYGPDEIELEIGGVKKEYLVGDEDDILAIIE